MSNKVKAKKRKHLTKHREHQVLQKVAPKVPKWKLAKFNKFLIKGINKSSISLKKFRSIYNNNKEFEEEVATLGNILLSTEFSIEDREVFYKDLELVIVKYK